MVLLADFTTMHIGGSPNNFLVANTEAEIIQFVSQADDAGRPIVVMGGGSNIIFSDDFRGDVLHISTQGFVNDTSACAGAWVTVQAGHSWDDFVSHCVANGWVGVEALSGIPGTTGATPIQNVGAYGQQVSQVIAQVRVWNRATRKIETIFAADCNFAYRSSLFKSQPDAWIILSVTFQLSLGTLSTPITYAELADVLGIEKNGRADLNKVRETVLELRRNKGMVIDPTDHDTWSVGSFFLNPVVNQVPEGAVGWPQEDGGFKVSAAWLIEQAGFGKGFSLVPQVSLSSKHSLAITNRGAATASQVLNLARHIQSRVQDKFGISLEIEPRIVS